MTPKADGSGPSPRVVLLEPDSSGHHLAYAALLLGSADAFLLTSSQATQTAEYQLRLSQQPNVTAMPSPRSLTRVTWVWRLARLSQSAQRAVIPHADHYLPWLWLWPFLSRSRLTGLIMRVPARRASRRRRAKTWIGRALALLPGVDVLYLQHGDRDLWPMVPVADPVQFAPSPGFWELQASSFPVGRVAGIVGLIDERKQPSLLHEVCELAGATLVTVGRHAKKPPTSPTWWSFDGLVPDEALDDAVRRMDALLLCYTEDIPSGILGKAAAAGTPVVVWPYTPDLAKAALAFGVGVVATSNDAAALAAALDEALLSGRRSPRPDLPTPQAFVQALLSGSADGPVR